MAVMLTGCQKTDSIYDVEDGVLPPGIYINGNLYGPHPTKRSKVELDDNFSYYGTIQSVVNHKFDIPNEELQVSNVMSQCVGYAVYISDDKDEVAIFIESSCEYAYFD